MNPKTLVTLFFATMASTTFASPIEQADGVANIAARYPSHLEARDNLVKRCNCGAAFSCSGSVDSCCSSTGGFGMCNTETGQCKCGTECNPLQCTWD